MTRKKEVILRRIIEFYIDSSEFKGIPHWQLHAEVGGSMQELNTLLEELLFEHRIFINYVGNTQSNQYHKVILEEQLSALKDYKSQEIGVYPARSCLQELVYKEYKDQPFSIMAFLGKPLSTPEFFEMEALEYYFQNSGFIIEHGDFEGSIARKGSRQAENNFPVIPTFGLGYKDNGERVLAVYLQHLYKLSARHQQLWEGFLVNEECRVAYEYQQEYTKGKKPEYRSIFIAFLAELYHINRMSDIIFGKTLFRKDFIDERPPAFKTIFRPTRDNYIHFLQVLKKVMPDNLNPDFLADYKKTANNISMESTTDMIQAFKLWLQSHIRISHREDFEVIFDPFYRVYSMTEEQCPVKADCDKEVFAHQNQLMVESYNAVKMLRLLFANHPSVKDYEVPDWLQLGKVAIY